MMSTPGSRWCALLLGAALLLPACDAPRPLQYQPAPGALGPYSGAVRYAELLFVSGKVGPAGVSFEEEAEGALRQVQAELSVAGATLADLLSVTVYLVDVGDYEAFNAVYARVVPAPWPARACVGVAALPGGRRVEVSAIARRPAPAPDDTAPSTD